MKGNEKKGNEMNENEREVMGREGMGREGKKKVKFKLRFKEEKFFYLTSVRFSPPLLHFVQIVRLSCTFSLRADFSLLGLGFGSCLCSDR